MIQRTRPMDRLVCGDVGFGKTEIAMRAIFRAVLANRQVQHYNCKNKCEERFEYVWQILIYRCIYLHVSSGRCASSHTSAGTTTPSRVEAAHAGGKVCFYSYLIAL